MKSDLTICTKQIECVKIISEIMLLFSSLILYSCVSSEQENFANKSEIDNKQGNDKVFTFHQNKNGKDNYGKAVFKEGELIELYKNSQKIHVENIEDYTGLVIMNWKSCKIITIVLE
jgi:hypothetical protein